MVPAQIEREILIDAPIDVVWRVVTEPELIQHWFAEEVTLDARAGGTGRMVFKSGDSYQLQVEAVDQPRRFVYRWVQPAGSVARDENSMLVEFTLHAEGDGTRLRVVESGFDRVDWADEKKARYAEDHSSGWGVLLARLAEFAPRAATGKGQ